MVPDSPLHESVEFKADAEESLLLFATTLADIADIVRAEGTLPPSFINQLFRAAHSLKGLASLAGRTQMAALAHTLENVLEQVRFGRVAMTGLLVALMSDGEELLDRMSGIPEASLSVLDHQMVQRLQERLDAIVSEVQLPVMEPQGFGDILPPEMHDALSEYERHRLQETLSQGSLLYDVHVCIPLETLEEGFSAVSARADAVGELISTLPSANEAEHDCIGFNLLVATMAPQDVMDRDFGTFDGVVTLLSAQPAAVTPPAARAITVHDREVARDSAPLVSQTTVRVAIDKLDHLLHAVGAMGGSQASLLQLARRLRQQGQPLVAEEVERIGAGFRRRIGDLQRGVLSVRLVPTAQLFDKLALAARKIARELNKELTVRQFGAETELDKLIVEQLVDPLLHILRNAIDHGLETPVVRGAAGKSPQGFLRLAAYQLGDQVAIEIEDDGAGIDTEALVHSARERGLLANGIQAHEIDPLELMCLPGMTTAEVVTDISGRGVGMDVVKTAITALSGKVELITKRGVGTRFKIVVPTSLAIVPCLVVEASGVQYACPMSLLHETVLMSGADLVFVDDAPFIEMRKSLVPVASLAGFAGAPLGLGQALPECYLLVCQVGERAVGVVVDQLLDQEDVVVKPLGPLFSGAVGVLGASDIGEHGTVLVVDPGAVFNHLQYSAGEGRHDK